MSTDDILPVADKLPLHAALSLRHKLLVVVVATTMAALLVTGASMMFYDLRSYQTSGVNDLLTQPGPYAAHTNRLGDFIGVKQGGVLVAMAGERMKMPGLSEVSGVCTHPDHRGRGYAGALMRVVAERMLVRGETPWLHAYASNAGAIALYESLGFRHHAVSIASILVRD